jgi:glycosyltransferase involved in cell wall biosynthesis
VAPRPRFSILTPVHETPAEILEAMLRSVRRQRCADWQLCLVDDASREPHVGAILARAQSHDPRVRVRRRESNGGIVAASNDALEMADGEFVVLLDHDDELHRNALSFVEEALRANPEADYLYTDEDKIDAAGHHSGPFFKPDWSPERMRTQMYTCHLSVLRRSLVEEVGGFDPELEGSQDWDLVLKVTERAREVLHVPKVLYHWRMLETSAAGGGEAAKPWAFEAGKRAVQAHCERIGLPARVERDPADPGVYHLEPTLERRPSVSIVIPTAGNSREVRYEETVLVTHCVRSIVETSTYENYEIVCVADDSTDAAVLGELREIGGDRMRLVRYEEPFNFSAKINLGAAHSDGEHVLLLNDDIEVVTPNWLERMAMYSGMSEVGAVGSRLLWQDGRLQHVGGALRRRAPRSHLPRLLRRLQGLLEQRPRRPELPRGHRRLPDDLARAVRGAGRAHHAAAGQLQRHGLLPEGGGERPTNRLRPRHDPVPLRVVQPLDRGGGVGEAAADRALAPADRGRPLLESQPEARHAADQRVAPLERLAPTAAAASRKAGGALT